MAMQTAVWCYDGYGMSLTNTLPLTLASTLPDLPDAATGLAHLGGGRWYDPALGRPLQPNAVGGPPTLPQALNRYVAMPLGQPGVAQATQQIMAGNRVAQAQYFLDQARGEMIEGFVGLGVEAATEAYARASVKGTLHVSARRIARFTRAGYGSAFAYNGGGRYTSELLEQLGPTTYRAADSGLVIDLALVRRGHAHFQPRFGFDESGLKRFLGGEFTGEFAGGLLVELAFAIPDIVETWDNPYF